MSDRGFLFLFSIVMIAAGLGAAVWLFATKQAGTVDGLFMLLTSLLIAVVFGMYVVYVIHRAMEAPARPAQTAKATAAAPAAKRAPTPAAQA